MMAMYTSGDPPVAPQHVDPAAMYYYNNDNNAGSFVAPHQVLGMPYNVNDPGMAGGAFDGDAAAFVAPQGLGDAAPYGNQLAVGDDHDLAAMGGSDENEDNFSFPLEALLGLDAPMYDGVGHDGQQGGATDATAADANAAGTYLSGGEGGMENWDMGAAEGDGVMDDIFLNSNGDFMFPHYMNNDGRE